MQDFVEKCHYFYLEDSEQYEIPPKGALPRYPGTSLQCMATINKISGVYQSNFLCVFSGAKVTYSAVWPWYNFWLMLDSPSAENGSFLRDLRCE